MQELYALADALKKFKLPPSAVPEVSVGRVLNSMHVMKLVTMVCGVRVGQVRTAAIEAEYSVTLFDDKGRLFENLDDDPGK